MLESIFFKAANILTGGLLKHFVSRFGKRREKIEQLYEFGGWKSSKDLISEDILAERGSERYGFRGDVYLTREVDEKIRNAIEQRRNFLVVGEPLAGKTRSVYRALKESDNTFHILKPSLLSGKFDDFILPPRFSELNQQVLILDDINEYLKFDSFIPFLQKFVTGDLFNHFIVISTCQNGIPEEILQNKLSGMFSAVCQDRFEISDKLTEQQFTEVCNLAGIKKPDRFDGNIGSIFLKLDEKIKRYNQLDVKDRDILCSLKRLYLAGIYQGRDLFDYKQTRAVLERIYRLTLEEYDWKQALKRIEEQQLLELRKESIYAESAYFKLVVSEELDLLENFDILLEVFESDPDMLVTLGHHAHDLGDVDLRKALLNKIAIKSYKKALEKSGEKITSDKMAIIQNSLGNTYTTLADVEEKAANCKLAIRAFNESLRVFTFKDFPMDYAITQNNRSNTYRTLGEVEDKAANCNSAIQSSNEALRVITFEDFPMDYAMTQNNLGNAYGILSEVEDKAASCKLAIKVYNESLRVYTFEDFPVDYAMTQNNLGIAYQILAEVEDKASNCKLAIQSSNEALRVYTFADFPMQYALTQNNLGAAYGTLGEVEGKSANCKLAIRAYNESLRVFIFADFPMDYAMTQNNLGTAYSTLGMVEEKATNCKLAIKAFNESIHVYTFEGFPIQYAVTQGNLAGTYSTLGEVENKRENLERAIEATEESINGYDRSGLVKEREEMIGILEYLKGLLAEEE